MVSRKFEGPWRNGPRWKTTENHQQRKIRQGCTRSGLPRERRIWNGIQSICQWKICSYKGIYFISLPFSRIPWKSSFRYILFHEKRLQTMLWHHNARVNSHQRWKQTRFRVCCHLWCELTSTMNVTEWQVSWNSCTAKLCHNFYTCSTVSLMCRLVLICNKRPET